MLVDLCVLEELILVVGLSLVGVNITYRMR